MWDVWLAFLVIPKFRCDKALNLGNINPWMIDKMKANHWMVDGKAFVPQNISLEYRNHGRKLVKAGEWGFLLSLSFVGDDTKEFS